MLMRSASIIFLVALLVGAWIEICAFKTIWRLLQSLSLRERGLKLAILLNKLAQFSVALLAGAWIEIETGEEYRAEVHWFQEETVGKVKFKVKEWIDEG